MEQGDASSLKEKDPNSASEPNSPTLETVSGFSTCSSPVPPEPFEPLFTVKFSNTVEKDGDVVKYTIKSQNTNNQVPAIAFSTASPTIAAMTSVVATPMTVNTTNSVSPVISVNHHQINMLSDNTQVSHSQVLTKQRLQDLVREVDPNVQPDEDVEELLMQLAEEFIHDIVDTSCRFAKHRKSHTLEVKDVQLSLEKKWNMWIPGFGGEELRTYKKSVTTDAHRQRMTLIKRAKK